MNTNGKREINYGAYFLSSLKQEYNELIAKKTKLIQKINEVETAKGKIQESAANLILKGSNLTLIEDLNSMNDEEKRIQK